MASKRNLRRKACGSKRKLTKAQAQSASYSLYKSQKLKNPVAAYKCEWCGSYHIGHLSNEQLRKINENKRRRYE